MKPSTPIAIALISACVLVGCGGGGDDEPTAPAPVETAEAALSKAELLAQGDAICAEVNAAVGTLSSTTGADPAARVAQEAELYGGMVERLKDLGEPAEESAGYSEFISAAEQLDQAESDAQLAAERGDEGGLAEAQSAVGTALESFQEAAAGYGFKDCSEGPSAPVPAPSGEEGGEEEAAPEEVEEAAPEEVEEAAPEEVGGVEEGAGGGAAAGGGAPGGGTETPGGEAGGGSSGGIGPG
jgi:hypothetical protein